MILPHHGSESIQVVIVYTLLLAAHSTLRFPLMPISLLTRGKYFPLSWRLIIAVATLGNLNCAPRTMSPLTLWQPLREMVRKRRFLTR